MEKLRNILLILVVLGVGFLAGYIYSDSRYTLVETTIASDSDIQEENTYEDIKAIRMLTESTDDFKLDEGDTAIELSNGSWAISNDKTKTYVFQAKELGDWEYKCSSKEELQRLIESYISIKRTDNI